jgi:RNA polymerase sigma factor (sigma-70 family)
MTGYCHLYCAATVAASQTNSQPEPNESSLALLERAREGDAAALESLLGRHWARGRLPIGLRDLADTDDLVQDTLIAVIRNVPSFSPRGDEAFELYLHHAVWNRIRDEIRGAARRAKSVAPYEAIVDPGPSPIALAIGQQALERYEKALQELSEEEREAIVGRFELGYDYRELARALGKFTADAARKTVQRAVRHLAEKMARER